METEKKERLDGGFPNCGLRNIPITEDFLRRNGFDECGVGCYRWNAHDDEDDDFYEVIWVRFDRWGINVEARVLHGRCFEGKLDYADELQEVIRLCKITRKGDLTA